MKIKLIISLMTLFSLNANAHLLTYAIDLETTTVEGPAFGGVSVGEMFLGSLAIDTHTLQDIVDTDGGFATVLVPLQDVNGNFNLTYSIDVGNYQFTEQSAGFFNSEFTVDDPANVGAVVAFSLDIGDLLSFNDLAVGPTNGLPMTGSWSATDCVTGNVVSGNLTVSAVPVPAAVWLFGCGLLGLACLQRRTHSVKPILLISGC